MWASVFTLHLQMLDKLQKRIYRTALPKLAASIEPLSHN